MFTHLRRNAVAYLALAVVLTSGTSYAAGRLGKNTVGTKQLKANAVVSTKVKDGSLSLADLAPFLVTGAEVEDGSLAASELAPGSVTGAKLAVGAVDGSKIADGTVTAADLAPGVLPLDAEVFSSGAVDPTAAPDGGVFALLNFAPTRAGTMVVSFRASKVGRDCTSGAATGGLYLDGVPVAGSAAVMAPNATPLPFAIDVVLQVTAGPHAFSFQQDCPAGNLSAGLLGQTSWVATLLPT